MKKFIAIVLAALMLVSLAACGGKDTASDSASDSVSENATDTASESVSDEAEADLGLLDKTVLSVGAECSYPPFETMAEDGVTPIGFDVDLAKAIAEKLGVECNFINTAWDGIFAGIGTNYDVAISGVTITDERKAEMDFSTPYINNYQAVIAKKGSDIEVKEFADLDGHSISVMKDTASDILVTGLADAGTISATVKRNEQVPTCYTELKNGEVDLVVCDSTVASAFLTNYPDDFEVVFTDESAPEQFAVAIKKGNDKLTEAINAALAELEAEGFFEANMAKWFAE